LGVVGFFLRSLTRFEKGEKKNGLRSCGGREKWVQERRAEGKAGGIRTGDLLIRDRP